MGSHIQVLRLGSLGHILLTLRLKMGDSPRPQDGVRVQWIITGSKEGGSIVSTVQFSLKMLHEELLTLQMPALPESSYTILK
jgi:hypothetical protein